MSILKNSTDNFSNQPFKDLKKILKRKRRQATPESTESRQPQSLSDEDIFLESMREVMEIEEYRALPVYHKQDVFSKKGQPDHSNSVKALEEIVEGKRSIHLPDTPEYVEWVDQGYRDEIIQFLHEGKVSIQDCLDLHGAIIEEAELEVERFIKDSIRKGYKCIKIIHGRGLRSPNGPVLKEAVVKWLLSRFRKYVAAFVSARQCDGGLGAVYVLLK
jgi:DNA-nicking Smr family endonuclease